MKFGGLVLLGCLVAASVNCDTLSVSDDEGSNGGAPPGSGTPGDNTGDGGPGPTTVSGSAAGDVGITAVEAKPLPRGRATSLKVTIKRTAPFAGAVAVGLANPPAGLTSEPLTIAPGTDVGDLVLTGAPTLAIGKLPIVVEATAVDTKRKATFPLDLTINGTPGELDASLVLQGTFADKSEGEIAVLPDGRFFTAGAGGPAGSAISLYSANGQVETSFSEDGWARFGVSASQIVVQGNGLLVGGRGRNLQPPMFLAYLRRVLMNGEADPAWNTFQSWNGAITGFSLAPNGKLAVLARPDPGSGWNVFWLLSTGALDTSVNGEAKTTDTTPSVLTRGVYDGTHLYAVGDAQLVRLSATGGALDSGFGTSGRLTFPGAATLTSIASDSLGRVLVGGMAGGGVYLGRSDGGKVDTTFAVSGYAVNAAKGGGAITQQPDKKILQAATIDAGGVDRCVVLRYLEDGKLDPSFGNAGVAAPAVDGCVAGEIGLQPDGKILVAGPKVIRLWP